MKITIYGKPGCPCSEDAKEIAKNLKAMRVDVQYDYICTRKENIGRAALVKITGKDVSTVPQVFVNDNYLGGFKDFQAFVKNNFDDRFLT